MTISFRVTPHSQGTGTHVVEILENGEVIGAIYPEGDRGIKLVSVHVSESSADKNFTGTVVEDDGSGSWPPIPAYHVAFEPSPWFIEGGRIVKMKPTNRRIP